jgi:branched-chain amino acid transport system permease protein
VGKGPKARAHASHRLYGPAAWARRYRAFAHPTIAITVLTILFDGVAYGMVLFVLAVGLSVTLGLMNFINLAHGTFAMAGGYVAVLLVNRLGVPFLAALPLVFIATALLGVLAERALYVHVYRKSHLDQVLFTIGLVFMSVAAVDYLVGSQQQFIELPQALRGRYEILGIAIGGYRAFIVILCGILAVALELILSRTRFGIQLRAGVDNATVARGLGIDVARVFTLTFAVGSGLAGLGGALGAEFLGLDPTFPLKFLVYFLIVVAVGGTSTLLGPFVAALILGVADVAGKYYLPAAGGFIIYTVMVAILLWRPHGLLGEAR